MVRNLNRTSSMERGRPAEDLGKTADLQGPWRHAHIPEGVRKLWLRVDGFSTYPNVDLLSHSGSTLPFPLDSQQVNERTDGHSLQRNHQHKNQPFLTSDFPALEQKPPAWGCSSSLSHRPCFPGRVKPAKLQHEQKLFSQVYPKHFVCSW